MWLVITWGGIWRDSHCEQLQLVLRIVQVPGPRKWLILGVRLTHLVESSDLFFLGAEVVYSIFQLDLLKNTRLFDHSKNSQNKNLKSKILAK